MDTSEAELPTPAAITEVDIANSTEINATDWKFIKDRQLFALSAADVNPVYKYVWIGESGDALVGDFAKSLFTHSKIEKIGKSCLLTNTVVNLIDSLPSGAKIINRESNYSISVKTDGYELVSEFTPKYESAEVGNYNAGIIINLMQTDENTSVTANADDIYTVLNQADILNTDKQPNIVCTVESKQITFHDNNVNCTIPVEGDHEFKYSITLDTVLLRSVISRCPESTISISPSIRENNVVGIVLSSGRLNVVLSGLS